MVVPLVVINLREYTGTSMVNIVASGVGGNEWWVIIPLVEQYVRAIVLLAVHHIVRKWVGYRVRGFFCGKVALL